jgi:hypothetical protein
MHRNALAVIGLSMMVAMAPAAAQEKAAKPSALDRIKALAGEWESRDDKGTVLTNGDDAVSRWPGDDHGLPS